MYEEIKVGTVIQTREKQLILVGYVNEYVMLFYEYSPDMLRSYNREKEWFLGIGFESEYPYVIKKHLDAERLMAWYVKNQKLYHLVSLKWCMPVLKDVKQIRLKDLDVFDIFLHGINLYIYLGKSFNNHYICYDLGEIDKVRNTYNLEEGNVCVVGLNEGITDLYYIRHITKELEDRLKFLPYGEHLFE